MFGFDTPVEETVFYKEVHYEGEVEGEIKGVIKGVIKGNIEGKIECFNEEIASYQQLHEQGYLPLAIYEEKVRGLNEKCRKLQEKLDKLD